MSDGTRVVVAVFFSRLWMIFAFIIGKLLIYTIILSLQHITVGLLILSVLFAFLLSLKLTVFFWSFVLMAGLSFTVLGSIIAVVVGFGYFMNCFGRNFHCLFDLPNSLCFWSSNLFSYARSFIVSCIFVQASLTILALVVFAALEFGGLEIKCIQGILHHC